ncbi:MAG: hypothetical protein WCC60_13185 [Ilumatobacteraceae bacterium]
MRDLEYIGGHPAAPHALAGIDVLFDDEGVTFLRSQEILGSIPWRNVRAISADAEVTSEHVSLPGVLLFGVLAFLFKRHDRTALLRVEDPSGAWVFAVPGIKLAELRAGVADIRRRHGL